MTRRGYNAPTPYRSGTPAGRAYGGGLFDQMYREMNDMLGRAQRIWGDDADQQGGSLQQAALSPMVDIDEDEKNYHLSVELPGIDPGDVDVSVTDGVLRISGEKRSKREENGEGRSFRERSYGRFMRSVRLPEDVDEDAIKANYENGVLELTLPKGAEEQSRTRRIDIAGADASRQLDKEHSAKAKGGTDGSDTKKS